MPSHIRELYLVKVLTPISEEHAVKLMNAIRSVSCLGILNEYVSVKRSRIIRNFPFRERFRVAMRTGKKTMTSRPTAYGEEGDLFEAFDAMFLLDSVAKEPLSKILLQWRAEGFKSKEEFIATWKQIHPIRKFNENDTFFVHRFHRIK